MASKSGSEIARPKASAEFGAAARMSSGRSPSSPPNAASGLVTRRIPFTGRASWRRAPAGGRPRRPVAIGSADVVDAARQTLAEAAVAEGDVRLAVDGLTDGCRPGPRARRGTGWSPPATSPRRPRRSAWFGGRPERMLGQVGERLLLQAEGLELLRGVAAAEHFGHALAAGDRDQVAVGRDGRAQRSGQAGGRKRGEPAVAGAVLGDVGGEVARRLERASVRSTWLAVGSWSGGTGPTRAAEGSRSASARSSLPGWVTRPAGTGAKWSVSPPGSAVVTQEGAGPSRVTAVNGAVGAVEAGRRRRARRGMRSSRASCSRPRRVRRRDRATPIAGRR